MPSWEDVVNQVVIPGDPGRLRGAQCTWSTVFVQIREARQLVADALTAVDGWEGEAADAWRAQVGTLASGLADLDEEYSRVQHDIAEAADRLEAAIDAIDIPAEMAPHVEQAKAGFLDGRPLAGLGPDALFNVMSGVYKSRLYGALQDFTPDFVKDAALSVRDALSDQAAAAERAYRTVTGDYATVHARMPEPTAGEPSGTTNVGDEFNAMELPGGGTGTSRGPEGQSGFASSAPRGSDASGITTSSGGAAGHGGLPVDAVDAVEPQSIGSGVSGLAGASTTGFVAAGGVPGSASGGLFDTSSGPGPGRASGGAATPWTGDTPLAGGGSARGAGGAGMVGTPMGGAPTRGSSDDERSTWLTEDDDVWSVDTGDLPPSLGAHRGGGAA